MSWGIKGKKDTTARTSQLYLISSPHVVLICFLSICQSSITIWADIPYFFHFTLSFLRVNEMSFALQNIQWKILIISQGHLRANFLTAAESLQQELWTRCDICLNSKEYMLWAWSFIIFVSIEEQSTTSLIRSLLK